LIKATGTESRQKTLTVLDLVIKKMSAFKTFEELEAWKSCREYRVFLAHQVFPLLLNKKEFSLLDQLKRSAR
jgi:hypothetical protein